MPLHLQDAYATLGYKRGDFPEAEKAAAVVLSLPMYPHLSVSQQERVVQEVFKNTRVRGLSDNDRGHPHADGPFGGFAA